jgi:hypothetical protein
MSKINPNDGMDVGTVVIVTAAYEHEAYKNGDYGTIIEDSGISNAIVVRFSYGKEYWVCLDEIRPKTLNDAAPDEWDKASKEPTQLDWVDEGAAALDKVCKVSLPFDMFYTSTTRDSKFAYGGDTTSMLGVAKAANAVLTAASRARLDTMGSSISTGIGVGKIAYVNVPTEDFVDSPAHYNNGGIECIDYIRQQLGEDGYIAYCEGNMIKYQHRYKYKGGIEDLEKSCKYQEWLIEALKAKEEIAMTEMTQRNL